MDKVLNSILENMRKGMWCNTRSDWLQYGYCTDWSSAGSDNYWPLAPRPIAPPTYISQVEIPREFRGIWTALKRFGFFFFFFRKQHAPMGGRGCLKTPSCLESKRSHFYTTFLSPLLFFYLFLLLFLFCPFFLLTAHSAGFLPSRKFFNFSVKKQTFFCFGMVLL